MACDFEGREGALDVHVKGMGRVEFGPDDVSLEIPTNELSTITADYGTSGTICTPWSPVSINGILTSMIGDSLQSGASELKPHSSDGQSSWGFSENHLEILARFQSRTSLTVGGMVQHGSLLSMRTD